MSTPSNISSVVLDNKLYITFYGRLDTATILQIQTEVTSIVAETQHPLVFDLEKVDFVASAFLRLCILTARTVGTERFSLMNVNPTISRVFSISGLDKHLQIT